MKQLSVDKKKLVGCRIKKTDIEIIKKFAEDEYEGIFSLALRRVIELGIASIRK